MFIKPVLSIAQIFQVAIGSSGCPPLLGIYPLRDRPHPGPMSRRCYGFNQNGYEFVKTNGVKTVFLVARWDYYVDGADKGQLNAISDVSLKLPGISQTREIYNEAIKRTFNAYKALGVKVLVVLQVPHQDISVIRFLEDILGSDSIDERKRKFREAHAKGVKLEEHLQRQKIASSMWRKLSKINNENELIVIDPTPEFCGVERCGFIEGDVALYTDITHASELGYDRLEAKFMRAFEL